VKTLILDVCSPAESMADFVQSWKTGKGHKAARISFATPELLWDVLTTKRWQLLKALCGAGLSSLLSDFNGFRLRDRRNDSMDELL
jgi:hypothetical protein